MKNKNIHKLFSFLLSMLYCFGLAVSHSFSNTNNDSIVNTNRQRACEYSDSITNYQLLESTLFKLYKLGYRQMPAEMQTLLLAKAQDASNSQLTTLNSQPIFSQIDNNIQYLTLSNNTFPEIIPTANLVSIGNTTLDISSHKICNINTTINTNITDPIAFALSIDPLAAKFPDMSPYNAMGNNPINRIDPTGMADEAVGNFDQLPSARYTLISDEYIKYALTSGDPGENVLAIADGSKDNNVKYSVGKARLRSAMPGTPMGIMIQKAVPTTEFDKLMALTVNGDALSIKCVRSTDVINLNLEGGLSLQIESGAAIDFSQLDYVYNAPTATNRESTVNIDGTLYLQKVALSYTIPLIGKDVQIGAPTKIVFKTYTNSENETVTEASVKALGGTRTIIMNQTTNTTIVR